MLRLIQLFLFSLVAIDAFAQANELQFIGQPVQNRDTNEVIAMVCLDSACAQVQAAYFKDPLLEDAKYFGAVYQNTPEGHQQFKKEFKKDQRHTYSARTEFAGGLISGVGLVVLSSQGPAFLAGFGIVLVGGVLMVAADTGSFKGVASTQISTAIKNQDGWNWSIRPKLVSKKRFDAFYWFVFGNHCCAIRKMDEYFVSGNLTTSSYEVALESARKHMDEYHLCSGIADYTKKLR